MLVKRLQQFTHLTSGIVVKVTKIIKPEIKSRKKDLCLVTNIIDGNLVKGTERYIVSETLRRHYSIV